MPCIRYGVVFRCLARFHLDANLVCSAVLTKSHIEEGGGDSDLFANFAIFAVFREICGHCDFRRREFCDYVVFCAFLRILRILLMRGLERGRGIDCRHALER